MKNKQAFTLAEGATHVAQNDDHNVTLNSIQSLLSNRFRLGGRNNRGKKPFIKIATDCGTYDKEGKCMTKGHIYHMNKKTIWNNSYSKSRIYYKFCLMNGLCLWFRTARQDEYVNYKGYIGTFFIDTNGSKQPNAFGWDVFNFTIQNDVLIPEGCDKNFNDYKISCKDKNSVGNGCACYINLNNNMNYIYTK